MKPSSDIKPVSFGIAGVGGYGEQVRNYLWACGGPDAPGGDFARLVAVCEPDQQTHAAVLADLRQRGIAVFKTFDELLSQDIEAVWLPLPIGLHRPFTEQALATGKAVMCEKPAAGSIDDLDAMIAARDRSGLPVAIGFQDIYDPKTPQIKQLISAGAIGDVKGATLWATWPRDDAYYSRNTWAGAIKRGETWVLDSPANNALAHFINLCLFLLGPSPDESAQPQTLRAELYRARPIENYDTISTWIDLPGGQHLLVNLSHAAAKANNPRITIHGSGGRIQWANGQPALVESLDGRTLSSVEHGIPCRQAMVQRFVREVRGVDGQGIPLATLEVARAHLLVINGASQAARIHTVPDNAINPVTGKGGDVRAIIGIEDALAACAQAGVMLHESRRYDWTVEPGEIDLRDYRRFAGPRA